MPDITFIIVSAILAPLLVFLVTSFLRHKSVQDSLELEISSLKEKFLDSVKENFKLQEKNRELETKIGMHENKEAILAEYDWDDSLGTWKSRSEPAHFICNSCINKVPPIKTRLQKLKYSYKCTVKSCNQGYQSAEQARAMHRNI